jgi:hypothetical protein
MAVATFLQWWIILDLGSFAWEARRVKIENREDKPTRD